MRHPEDDNTIPSPHNLIAALKRHRGRFEGKLRMPLALYGRVGVGANEGEMAGRAGVSFGW